MKCEEVMEAMQRYLDEDLNSKEIAAMQEHMKTCASCAEMFERLTRLSEELVNLPKVEPPYSIVDSILPQLQEIDRQAPAASSPAPVVPFAEQRRKRQFMYRMIGGAAAAVLFIGAAVYQLPQFISSNSAEDSSFSGSSNSSMAADAAGSEKISILMSAEATSSNAASNQRSVEADESGAGGHNHAAPDLRDKHSALKEVGPNTGMMDFGGTEEDPPVAGGGADARSPEEERRLGLSESGVWPSRAPEDNKDGLTFNESVLEQLPFEAVPSPDHAFIAFAEYTEFGYQVVIIAEDGERIYASPAKQADEIRNLEWSETGTTLTYETAAGEVIQTFTIDVRTRTERQHQ